MTFGDILSVQIETIFAFEQGFHAMFRLRSDDHPVPWAIWKLPASSYNQVDLFGLLIDYGQHKSYLAVE